MNITSDKGVYICLLCNLVCQHEKAELLKPQTVSEDRYPIIKCATNGCKGTLEHYQDSDNAILLHFLRRAQISAGRCFIPNPLSVGDARKIKIEFDYGYDFTEFPQPDGFIYYPGHKVTVGDNRVVYVDAYIEKEYPRHISLLEYAQMIAADKKALLDWVVKICETYGGL